MRINKYGGYPIILGDQGTQTSSAPLYQPGAVFMWRKGTGNAYAGVIQYVQLDNNGCSYGQTLQPNDATITGYSVKVVDKSSGKGPNFVGIAAATIASQYFGFMVIGGYCEYAYSASAAASGNVLCLAATATGQLSVGSADYYTATTAGSDATSCIGIAVARGAITAAALGSVTLCGHWGI